MANFKQHQLLALLFLLPQLIIIVFFFIGPAIKVFIESFYFMDAFGLHQRFAGLQNYRAVFYDPNYFRVLGVTLMLSFAIMGLTMTAGLLLANLVKHCKKTQVYYKSLLLWPYAVAPAIAAILWRFLTQPSLGWFSQLFDQLGWHFNYLIHSKQALLIIVLAASWQQLSYNFLFYFAALQEIPQPIHDAAMLDGGSSWQRFWRITFPLLSPTTFFLIVMNIIYGFFETFGIIDILTAGGPDNHTATLIYKLYQDGFVGMDLGSASSQSILLMLIVMVITLLQFKFLEKRVHYE